MRDRMRSSCVLAPVLLMLLAVHLIDAEPDSGTVIPAESKIFMEIFSHCHCLDRLYVFMMNKIRSFLHHCIGQR